MERKIAKNAVYLRAFNEKFRSFSVKCSKQKCVFFSNNNNKKRQKITRIYLLHFENIQSCRFCGMNGKQKLIKSNNNNTKIVNLYAYYQLKTLFIYLFFFSVFYFHRYVCRLCCELLIANHGKQQLPMHLNWFCTKICYYPHSCMRLLYLWENANPESS